MENGGRIIQAESGVGRLGDDGTIRFPGKVPQDTLDSGGSPSANLETLR